MGTVFVLILIALFVALFFIIRRSPLSAQTKESLQIVSGIASFLAAVGVFLIPAATPSGGETPTIAIPSPGQVSIIAPTPSAVSESTTTPEPISTKPPLISSNNSYTINKTQNSNTPGVSVTVQSVEILPDNRMRWTLLFANDSNEDSNLNIWYKNTQLTDEFGNSYPVLADKAGTDPSAAYRPDLRAGARLQHWVEFPAPINGATQFTVALGESYNGPEYQTFQVQLPINTENIITLTPTIGDSPLTYTINKTQNSDAPGVSVTVQSVEILPDNRMRWTLLFANDSNEDSNLNIWYKNTQLTDEFGNSYPVLADKAGTDPSAAYRPDLRAGARLQHWVEFPAPINGATQFTVALGESYNGPEYQTFQVQLK